MLVKKVLFASVVALLFSLVCPATSYGQAQASSLKFPVAENFLKRLESIGLKPSDEKKPFTHPSGAVEGSFRYGDSGTYPGVDYLYVSKDGTKSWEQKKGRDFEYKDPDVTARFETYWISSYKHQSLESKAKKPRPYSQQYVKSLGAPPEVNIEKYEQVTETTYESSCLLYTSPSPRD